MNDGAGNVEVGVNVAVEVFALVVRLHLATFLPVLNVNTTSIIGNKKTVCQQSAMHVVKPGVQR